MILEKILAFKFSYNLRGCMTNKATIKEVFTSIQGEGPYIGYKQLFIRFSGCNLNCNYCDTVHKGANCQDYSVEDLIAEINKHSDCNSISLTGGEPLLQAGFLKEFLPQSPLPVYLETNATLAGELAEVIDYIDYVSADIKLPSCTGGHELWDTHNRFFEVAAHKNLFAKVVFDENITEDEISNCCKLAAKHNAEIILQPMMFNEKPAVDKDFMEKILDSFLVKYKKTRLIPQVHKFLNIR